MDDPSNPLSGAVWRRGALLGLQWSATFFVVTLLVYLALAGLGWSGVARALCAMAVGPFIAAAGIALWWMVRRPALTARRAARAPKPEPED